MGRSVHGSGTQKELVRVIAAIVTRDKFHINLLSPHCVSLCCVVSMVSHVLHRFVSVSLIAARQSLVVVRSWITTYHVDPWECEIHAVWRLVHRRFQLTSVYFRTTRITSPVSVLLRMALSIPYTRLLSLRMVSFVRKGDKYHMSRPYWRTWTSLLWILLICGCFPLHRFCSTFVRRQMSRRPSVRQMSTFSQRGSPDI
jgi:hypothetical protein